MPFSLLTPLRAASVSLPPFLLLVLGRYHTIKNFSLTTFKKRRELQLSSRGGNFTIKRTIEAGNDNCVFNFVAPPNEAPGDPASQSAGTLILSSCDQYPLCRSEIVSVGSLPATQAAGLNPL
jgi:hypothetical protein